MKWAERYTDDELEIRRAVWAGRGIALAAIVFLIALAIGISGCAFRFAPCVAGRDGGTETGSYGCPATVPRLDVSGAPAVGRSGGVLAVPPGAEPVPVPRRVPVL